MNRTIASSIRAAALIPAVALALVLGVPAFAQSAAAATPAAAPAGFKVGIVNIQSAIVTSNEGQRDFEALQKKFNTQADKLNDEARGDLLKQIDAKKKLMQRNYEDANTDIQAQQNEIANRIGQKLVEVLDKYAKEHDFVVILDVSQQQSPVLWAASSVDITKPVIEVYNATSGVPAPPAKAAGAAPSLAPGASAPTKPAAAAVSKK